MAVKTLTTRVQQKSDTNANWAKATNFTPLKGEIIVYTDLNKIKIGDGVTKVGVLEFVNAKDAETLLGASLSTILNSSDVEIPTSKAVLDALVGKNLSGETVPTNETTTVTAGVGAEVFNNYDEPTFSGDIPQTGNVASGNYSHAEGSLTVATGDCSHAEGNYTFALDHYTHTEGWLTQATASCAHAEGSQTVASGGVSHAEGMGTEAASQSQHVQGYYNIIDTEGSASRPGKYAHIVGNGTSDSARSNAHTLDWSGNAWYSGKVSVGTTSNVPTPTNVNDLVTKQYVDNKFSTRTASVTLASTDWAGTESPYSQEVTVDGATSNSKVDLQPTGEQLNSLATNRTILNTANDNGTVTVYAIGNKPTEDYTMQATITEV